MAVFSSPADLAAAVGTELGRSDWLTVEQARIDRFAEATGGLQVASAVTVELEGSDKPAAYAETLTRLYL